MNAANLRIAALVSLGSAFALFGLSFAFDDIVRLVLRLACCGDLVAGIVLWTRANRLPRNAGE